MNKGQGVIQDRFFTAGVLAFQREIETRISQKLSERYVLHGIIANSLHFRWAALRFIGHPDRRNENRLVIKCGDLTRYRSLNPLVVRSAVPWTNLAIIGRAPIIDAKRRTEQIPFLDHIVRAQSCTSFFEVGHFEFHVVCRTHKEPKHVFDLFQGGLVGPSQNNRATQLLGTAFQKRVGLGNPALRKATTDGFRSIENVLSQHVGRKSCLSLVVAQFRIAQ
mmetsp:Transcript_9004/g.22297  ORF Transcript_9004/g.22297 Transcript_9004/m.22297 type:complete len:221 (+) Transcript_9004:2915-3577(+)